MSNTKKIILLIEDDESLLLLYKTVLSTKINYDVMIAKNYIDAKKILEKKIPIIILLDLLIPANLNLNIDYNNKLGFRLLQEIRNDLRLKEIPVIILTNLNSPEDREKSKKMGANLFLVKANILPKDLAIKINDFLK